MSNPPDAHSIKWLDLPLMLRLKQQAIFLHSELGLTEDARGQNSALLSSMIFPRGDHILLARLDDREVVGRFRYRPDDAKAHIVFLAPSLDTDEDDSIWLHMLDAVAGEAGRIGAQTLVGEVDLRHRLFDTMRRAGYAVYSRQVIWQGVPPVKDAAPAPASLSSKTAADEADVALLLGTTIPRILQPVLGPAAGMAGLVYRKDGRIAAYIAHSAGRHGIYLLPFLQPDALDEAADIISAALQQLARSRKLPVYVCVRGYQGWLENAMRDLNFQPGLEQAVMVKHLTAGVRHAAFKRVDMQARGRRESVPSLHTTGASEPKRSLPSP